MVFSRRAEFFEHLGKLEDFLPADFDVSCHLVDSETLAKHF